MMVAIVKLILATAAFVMGTVNALYVQEFRKGDEVPLMVNAMTSIHTQIPKDYYSLPFCQPSGGPKMASENLGEILTGHKIQSSPYELNMLTETYCMKVCQVRLSRFEATKMHRYIKYGYHNNWMIDNLPSAAVGLNAFTGEKQKHYAGGFPIGFIASNNKRPYIFNHVNIIVDYHQRDPAVELYRVVGFAVEPMSVHHEFQGGYVWDEETNEGLTKPLITCESGVHMERDRITMNQQVDTDATILFTYDVIWKASDVAWSSRWDIYLSEDDLVPAQVHWYSIVNSLGVVLFLSIFIIIILVRNLRCEFHAYNAVATLADEEADINVYHDALEDSPDEEEDDDVDKSGWKSLHADVFRPPTTMPMMYCVCIGEGVHLLITILLVLVLAATGFVSQSRRGSLMNAFLVIYMLSSVVAGYVSSRLYKAFEGKLLRRCTVLTALLFPGVAFGLFLFFNVILFFMHSTASVPFLGVVMLAAMWCCVSIPLVFVGASFGDKKESIKFPTVTSTTPRAIPPPSKPVLHPTVGIMVAGFLPLSAEYVELFFIMTSLWMGQYYDVFGFTLIVYLIVLITCAEVTVLLVYWQLRAENHRWWWFSFLAPGSTALYTFVYSSIFWFQSMEVSPILTTYLLYFGYMGLICFAMLLVTGTVGSLTALWLVRTMYGTIKKGK